MSAGIISRALFNPLVVVTIMTTVALILGVLALTSAHPSKKVLAICAVIGVFGLIAVIYEIKRLYRLERVRERLSTLLAEGQNLTHTIAQQNPRQRVDYPNQTVTHQAKWDLLARWCASVDTELRRELGESYVGRFHQGGSNEQDATSMTIWKMNHRLETLASFLVELGHK